ncbi:hypothetical protein [Paenibacillus sp. N3.4]|uniref:hypothetical protein n=1 Tax=Paenibacillus sp. N3.4 TaxID=2603222 RepID=UPI0011C7AA74|nr:hypothetical protein [Paenibacillus sp. N3.4]TXK80668.1 hypothetical protein FU659_17760 [Paenibacillus sp. N3.4]
MNEREAIDKFGELLMTDLRDRTIDFFELLVKGHWKAPKLQQLQHEMQSFDDKQIELFRRALIRSLDSGIHDFLFKLQEQADFNNEIEIKVQGINIIQASDGLHGELFTEDGWFANFSKYGENNKEEF